MNEREVNRAIAELELEGVLANGQIRIYDIEATLSLRFCNNCWNSVLEGLALESSNPSVLDSLLGNFYTEQGSANIQVDNLVLRNSFDLMPHFDTLTLIYTDRMVYDRDLNILKCKRLESDPCF